MLVMASVVVLILWIDFSSNKRKRALKETKPMSSYRFILLIIGAYIILDGFGSILIYQQQPLFPDHFVRIIRMIVGGIIICIGENLGRN
jgi:undecaprenyl pyrophosphate phosphatase UppP